MSEEAGSPREGAGDGESPSGVGVGGAGGAGTGAAGVAGPSGGGRDPRARERQGGGGDALEELRQRLVWFAAARHWQPYHTPKNLAAALSVEAGELLEIFQWLTPDESAAVMDDRETAARVRDEVADVLAYLLQFCSVLGVDPVAALHAKIDRNETRFPLPEGPDQSG